MRRAAAEALWRTAGFASLYLRPRRNTKHPTPNFAELSAFGDQRWTMRVFFDRATGGTAWANLCSDATSEERMLSNAFGAGRFSF
jgi:hypothetical protein